MFADRDAVVLAFLARLDTGTGRGLYFDKGTLRFCDGVVGMELIILPLFFPLLLVGWVFDDAQRLARRRERDVIDAYARTWMQLHASVDELTALERAHRAPNEVSRRRTRAARR